MTFYGIDTATPVNVENGRETVLALTLDTPSVTKTVNNTILVTAHSLSSSAAWTPPVGMTEAVDVSSDAVPLVTGISLELSYVNQSSAGPTGTKTATASNDADSGVAQILALQAPPVSILYAVTYTAGANGTISGTTPQLVNHGGSGTAVTAVPNTGYHFVDWSDTSTDNPRTDTNVTADLSVTAGFALNQYTLPVNLVGSGSVIKDPDQSICFYGDKITLTAAATPGWTFVEWGGDLSGPDNPKFITLDDKKSVTATFRALLFLPLVVGHYGG